MDKQQIIEAIVSDLAGRLNQSIDLCLSEQGEHDLMEAIQRPYMNNANAMCAQEWVKTLSFCQQANTLQAHINRKLVNVTDCDDNQPNGENLAGPFDSEQEAKAHANDYTGDLYVVCDDLTDSGYYLYALDSTIQSPAFRP